MAIVASALVTLPAALSTSGATAFANAADQSPAPPVSAPYPVPAELGATGSAPHDATLSPQLIHDAANPAALAASLGPRADVPSGPLGIPGIVLDAYLKAQQALGVQQPNCKLPWWLLAGIGKIESGQAEGGEVDQQGNTLRPILGPELDGTNGNAALPAILGGRWTGDTVWQRAVGPMQFLPSTWLEWGGNGNPNNVYDSAIAAGKYLCSGGRDLSDPAQQAVAVFSYNHSDSYVQIVLVWANAYRAGVTPLPETTVVPMGPVPTGTPVTSTTTTTTTTTNTTTTTTTTTGGGGSSSTTTTTTTTKPPPTSGTTTTPPPTTSTTTCPSPSSTTNPPSSNPPSSTPNPPGCAGGNSTSPTATTTASPTS
jgi:membrane-bound lytic murein transglycosylase B